MAIELHHLHPGHDDELSLLKARIAELEKENAELKEAQRWRNAGAMLQRKRQLTKQKFL